MKAEYDAVLQTLDHVSQHRYAGMNISTGMKSGKKCVVALSGVGKVAAAMATEHLIAEYQPGAVLFTGVGGALNETYQIGDVVLSKDCVQHDMDGRGLGFARGQVPYTTIRFIQADEALLSLANSATIGHKIHCGRVLTGDQFIMDKHHLQYQYLFSELNGDAVDMEGAAMAYVCRMHNIPFLLIRTISDEANEHSPVNFEEFLPVVAQNAVGIVKHIIENIK